MICAALSAAPMTKSPLNASLSEVGAWAAAAVPVKIRLRKITKRAFVDELLSIILPSRNRRRSAQESLKFKIYELGLRRKPFAPLGQFVGDLLIQLARNGIEEHADRRSQEGEPA